VVWTDLCAGSLTTDGQTHGVASSSVCSHISQTLDVVLQFPPQVVLNSQVLEFCREVVDSTVTKTLEFCGVVNGKTSHEALGDLRADTVEALEGALDEARFGKVDSKDELVRELASVCRASEGAHDGYSQPW
jgi:hypothetical protein